MPDSPTSHLTVFDGLRQSILDVDRGLDASACRGLYIHVPFCFHKCHYCDFYSIVDNQDREAAFVKRLIEEIETAAAFLPVLETIFVGGGTPTLLSIESWSAILDSLGDSVSTAALFEFTVEANPETVAPALARTLAAGGVNRVSIGAQSFNPAHLKTLERWHEPKNVARSTECFRDAGIGNINLDLICAIPGQALDDFKRDLDAALALAVEHLSCYTLIYEPNTPLTKKLRAGAIERTDEDLEARMYEWAMDHLPDAGFEHYEISNWALPGRQCRHNRLYWTDADWWPIGPSASGHAAGRRWKNVPRLTAYLESSGLAPVQDVERGSDSQRAGEALMMGLRLLEGMPVEHVERLAAGDPQRERALQRHLADGLLEAAGGSIRLSRRGLLLADSVFAELV